MLLCRPGEKNGAPTAFRRVALRYVFPCDCRANLLAVGRVALAVVGLIGHVGQQFDLDTTVLGTACRGIVAGYLLILTDSTR